MLNYELSDIEEILPGDFYHSEWNPLCVLCQMTIPFDFEERVGIMLDKGDYVYTYVCLNIAENTVEMHCYVDNRYKNKREKEYDVPLRFSERKELRCLIEEYCEEEKGVSVLKFILGLSPEDELDENQYLEENVLDRREFEKVPSYSDIPDIPDFDDEDDEFDNEFDDDMLNFLEDIAENDDNDLADASDVFGADE